MAVGRILEAGVIMIAFVYKSYRLLNQDLHPGSTDQSLDKTSVNNYIGYFMPCFIFLLISSFLVNCKIENTRNGLGGAVFSIFLPIIYLERYATMDQSLQSYEDLLCHLTLCQVQLAVILALSMCSYFRPARSLLFFLVAGICLWIVTGSLLEAADQLIVVLSSLLFAFSLYFIFGTFPQTFSFGEGIIICQALSSASLTLIQSSVWAVQLSVNGEEHASYDFISLICAGIILASVALDSLLPTRSLDYFLIGIGISMALSLSLYSGHLQRVMVDIIGDAVKILLVGWWILLVSGSLLLVATYNRKRWPVTSTDRKHFHLLAILIFLPGILAAPHLIKLASAAALTIFVILEYIRYMKLPYLGEHIHAHLRIFLDKRQDSGSLILTHIYLLCGCSTSLWLTSSSKLSGESLALHSGVISLGVGDTFASVIGSQFGHHRYPGSKKTLEGTLAAFLSMLMFSMALTTAQVGTLTWKLLLVAMLESCTEHVDNLVLPLYTFVILS